MKQLFTLAAALLGSGAAFAQHAALFHGAGAMYGGLDLAEAVRLGTLGRPVPLEVADGLSKTAADTLRQVAELRQTPRMSRELRLTLGDLEAMSHLGNYYGAKIRGAAELALFDATSKPENGNSGLLRWAW
jgi:hypothetical protein